MGTVRVSKNTTRGVYGGRLPGTLPGGREGRAAPEAGLVGQGEEDEAEGEGGFS